MLTRIVVAARGCRALRWLPLVLAVGCAVPPDYPPDDTHVSATEASTCFGCHVTRARGPRPHPSHFEDDGSFKATRRACHSCHEPAETVAADSTITARTRPDG